MRVAVLGAGGTIAPAIVRDLADSSEVEEMLLLDLDPGRAREVADAHGAGRARSTGVDARVSDELAAALRGCDVLVNSASYRINLEAMRAALDASCHYLDLGGLYWMTRRQLALRPEFRSAGLVAVLGVGSAPGKTNLMAALAVERLGGARSWEREKTAGGLDFLHVAAAGRDLDPPEGESFPYALQTLLDEVTMAPVTVRGGEPVEVEPLRDGGEINFDEPIGRARAIYTLHSEMLTFPSSFGCREASFRLSLAEPVEARLRELAAAGEQRAREVAAAAAQPSSRTVSVHLVDAGREGRSLRVRSLTPPHERWGLGGGIVSTASPAAACVRLLARGEIDRPGVHPPECCIAPDTMFSELGRRGVRFTVEELEAAGMD